MTPRACVAVLVLSAAAAFHCTDTWPDHCAASGGPPTYADGTTADGAAAGPCTPYAPPLPPGTDLHAVRARLVNALFGVSTGTLPTAGADAVTPEPPGDASTSRGCWCSTLGNCAASACAWSNNKTRLLFTVRAPLPNGTEIVLNSTAFWTLNTSGVAPSTYIGEFGPPAFGEPPLPPLRHSDTVVVWHQVSTAQCCVVARGHRTPACACAAAPAQSSGDECFCTCRACESTSLQGHNSPCNISGGDADYDGVVDHLNQLGFGACRRRRVRSALPRPGEPTVRCTYAMRTAHGCPHSALMRRCHQPSHAHIPGPFAPISRPASADGVYTHARGAFLRCPTLLPGGGPAWNTRALPP